MIGSGASFSFKVASKTVFPSKVKESFLHFNSPTLVQLLSPELSSTALVLDENSLLNDFWVSISNSGFHSDYLGYQTRDYKKYVALDSEGNRQNQVRFPFDIVLDIGNDFEQNNDQILSAGTWFTLGDKRQRMYLPMYIKEGNYTCEFRSLASNTGSQIEATEENKNTQRKNYVSKNRKRYPFR